MRTVVCVALLCVVALAQSDVEPDMKNEEAQFPSLQENNQPEDLNAEAEDQKDAGTQTGLMDLLFPPQEHSYQDLSELLKQIGQQDGALDALDQIRPPAPQPFDFGAIPQMPFHMHHMHPMGMPQPMVFPLQSLFQQPIPQAMPMPMMQPHFFHPQMHFFHPMQFHPMHFQPMPAFHLFNPAFQTLAQAPPASLEPTEAEQDPLAEILNQILASPPSSEGDEDHQPTGPRPMILSMRQQDAFYIVSGFLPGVAKSDLSIKLEGNRLLVNGVVSDKSPETIQALGEFANVDEVDETLEIPYAPDARVVKAHFDESDHTLTIVFPVASTSEIQLS